MSNQNTRTDDLDQLALLHQEQWDELDREHEMQRRDDDGLVAEQQHLDREQLALRQSEDRRWL